MTSHRLVVSVSIVAASVLGLGACSSEKPSGLTPFTPTATSSSSSPSPSSLSQWTPDQQQVIDGYDGFNNLITAIWTKSEKIDMTKAHRVAKDPFVTKYLKGIDAGLSAGFVQTGKVVSTVSSVTTTGDTATLDTCVDETQTKLINRGNPSGPQAQAPPPSRVTVSLVREGDSWLVAGLKGGGGACAAG